MNMYFNLIVCEQFLLFNPLTDGVRILTLYFVFIAKLSLRNFLLKEMKKKSKFNIYFATLGLSSKVGPIYFLIYPTGFLFARECAYFLRQYKNKFYPSNIKCKDLNIFQYGCQKNLFGSPYSTWHMSKSLKQALVQCDQLRSVVEATVFLRHIGRHFGHFKQIEIKS